MAACSAYLSRDGKSVFIGLLALLGPSAYAALGRGEPVPARRALDAALTALHGIGPWTADIYLLFCLGHADAFPSGDLAVQESARIAFDLRKRPDAKALAKMAEVWRPWRGVAAHLLWAYYHAVKKRDVVPVQPNGRPKKTAKTKTTKRKKKNG